MALVLGAVGLAAVIMVLAFVSTATKRVEDMERERAQEQEGL